MAARSRQGRGQRTGLAGGGLRPALVSTPARSCRPAKPLNHIQQIPPPDPACLTFPLRPRPKRATAASGVGVRILQNWCDLGTCDLLLFARSLPPLTVLAVLAAAPAIAQDQPTTRLPGFAVTQVIAMDPAGAYRTVVEWPAVNFVRKRSTGWTHAELRLVVNAGSVLERRRPAGTRALRSNI